MKKSDLKIGLLPRLLAPQFMLTLCGLTLTLYTTVILLEQSFYPLTDKNIKLTADGLAKQLSEMFKHIDEDLQIGAEQYDTISIFEEKDPKNFTWYADAVSQQRDYYKLLAVVDTQGKIVGTSTLLQTDKNSVASLMGEIIDIRGLHETTAGQSKIFSMGGGNAKGNQKEIWSRDLGIGIPIFDELDDSLLGYFMAFVSVEKVTSILESKSFAVNSGTESVALITHAELNNILFSPQLDVLVAGQVFNSHKTSETYRHYNTSITLPWEEHRWNVVTLVRLDLLSAPIDWLVNQILWICIVIGTLSLLATALVTRKLLLPVKKLTTAIAKASTAVPYEPVDVRSNDEIGFLSRTLTKTFAEISTYEREMTSLVDERTANLQTRTVELEDALRALEATQEELLLAQKHAALTPLVNGVAHELNTPLGVALTATSKLKDVTTEFMKKLEAKEVSRKGLGSFARCAQDVSSIVLESLNQGSQLVKDFKKLASIPETNSEARFELAPVLEMLKHTSNSRYPEAKLLFEIECEKGCVINGAFPVFVEVLSELVKNSIMHAEPVAGELRISVRSYRYKDNVSIEFADNGKGFPEAQLQTCMDPFVTSKRGDGHSGLGLTVAYSYISRVFGGRMSIANRYGGLVGQGAVCTLILSLCHNLE
jgi:signal transduction histidine kinase